MAETGTLQKVRDYALILLPVAYAVGFLSWSIHQAGGGMGFRTLSVPHYLVASFPVVAITGIGALIRTWFEHEFVNQRIWPWLFDIISFLTASWFVLGLMDAIGAIHWRVWDLFVITTVVGLMPMATRLGVAIVDWVSPTNKSSTRLINVQSRQERSPRRFAGDWLNVFTPSFTVLVLLLILNGNLLLGDVQQSFGGAAPRAAYLDLDPSQVEPSWQAVLFPNGTDLNAPVVRTVPVEVHHRNSDFILFRTAAEPEPRHRLFDLSTDVVKAIVWCGDSCDRWLPPSTEPPAANP